MNNLKNNPDLSTWLEHREQPLPESLAQILIEDCLEELEKQIETDSLKIDIEAINDFRSSKVLYFWGNQELTTFKFWDESYKIHFIQTLLSQINGKAVMLFLDVENKEYKNSYVRDCYGDYINTEPKTLHHLLFREFTEALRIGKTLEESLEIITKIYIKELYV